MNLPLFLAQEYAPTPPAIRDIAPPVYVFPYPLWMVYCGVGILIALLALVIWLVVRWVKRNPAPPPPTPRQAALTALDDVRARIQTTDPYAFSILVSDILRTYISRQYSLHATQQTSPEFLASIASHAKFTDAERQLLANFLEKCDLLKFARIGASADENASLLDQAILFVKGGHA